MTPEALAELHAQSGLPLRTWSPKEYEALLQDSTTLFIHNEFGFAIGTQVLDEAELLMIVVAHSARQNGKGKSLLAQFEKSAAQKGAISIFLEVSESNSPAQSLYLTTGYQEIGKRRNYYKRTDGNLETALMMKKIIA